MNLHFSKKGFTLVEMLIVVAIIGILGAVAIPAYKEQVKKSGRTEAIAMLNDVAQRMQRCYTANGRYQLAANPQCGVVTQLNTPPGIATIPQGLYNITVSNLTANTYTLTATPVAGRKQATDTKCISFGLTHTGAQTAIKSGNISNTNECWMK